MDEDFCKIQAKRIDKMDEKIETCEKKVTDNVLVLTTAMTADSSNIKNFLIWFKIFLGVLAFCLITVIGFGSWTVNSIESNTKHINEVSYAVQSINNLLKHHTVTIGGKQ